MPPVSQAQRRWAFANKDKGGKEGAAAKEFADADPGGKLPEKKRKKKTTHEEGKKKLYGG
jgi:hypothetical protein